MKRNGNKTRGAHQVYLHLSDHFDTSREKVFIFNSVKNLQINEVFIYRKTAIKKISAGKFQVNKTVLE